ncbi:MAG: amino acid ABC transporter permease [Ornithinimicrobium sp.]
MSAQQVLFDAPGPKAIARYRLMAVLGTVLIVAVLGWILWRMWEKDQLTAAKWSPFLAASTWQNYYLPAIWDTMRAAVTAIVLSMVFGLILAMGRMSDVAPIRWFCTGFVEFFRAVPVLIMMIFTFYYLSNQPWTSSEWNPFFGVIVGLVFYNSSVICEVIRSGVGSLPNGQREAGLSIGLSGSQTRRMILVPQALTSMLPSLVSQIIVILKDTALGFIILYPELLTRARQLGSAEANVLPAYLVAAVMFILINYGVSKIAEAVENRQRRRAAGAGKKAKKDDEGGMGGKVDSTLKYNTETG